MWKTIITYEGTKTNEMQGCGDNKCKETLSKKYK